jgi:hypothetical protein
MPIKTTRYDASDELAYNKFSKAISASLAWTVTGTDDESEAIAAAIEESAKLEAYGKTYRGIPRTGTSAIERLAPSAWRVTVNYRRLGAASKNDTDSGDYEVNIEISSMTLHIERPLQTIFQTGETHPNVIAPDDDGKAKGLDVSVACMRRTERHIMSNARFSPFFQKMLMANYNTTNINPFRGYEAGEVLFTGVSASQSGDKNSDWIVTFNFNISPNQAEESIVIGNDMSGSPVSIPAFTKQGWHYVWFSTGMTSLNPTSQNPSPIFPYIKGVYVEQIYKAFDFGQFRIGNS